MYRIAVIGDKDSVYGFAALGLDVVYVGENDDPHKAFKKLCESGYGIIYITEALAEILDEEIRKTNDNPIPAVILIPGISGNTGKGIANVKKAVEKAVGSDIIFND